MAGYSFLKQQQQKHEAFRLKSLCVFPSVPNWFTYWYRPDVSETNAVTSADGLASAACKRPLERVQWGYNVTLVILIYLISPMLTQQYLNNFCTAEGNLWGQM